jgi:exodeoxyribonuclease VII large subunit
LAFVQGKQAKDDIIEKIKYADQLDVDTIIVGRGGGSIEALTSATKSLNVKSVSCPTAEIIGVWHSNIALTTSSSLKPTQAAVMATPDQYELLQQIKQYQFTLTRHIKQYVEQHKNIREMAV